MGRFYARLGRLIKKIGFGRFALLGADSARRICASSLKKSIDMLFRARPACVDAEADDESYIETCDLPPGIKADVYCEPMVVIEVKAAQRTQSDLYGGWSLRFPRFIRRREDKKVSDASVMWSVCYYAFEEFGICLVHRFYSLKSTTTKAGNQSSYRICMR